MTFYCSNRALCVYGCVENALVLDTEGLKTVLLLRNTHLWVFRQNLGESQHLLILPIKRFFDKFRTQLFDFGSEQFHFLCFPEVLETCKDAKNDNLLSFLKFLPE